jgi:hypothetical protein
MSTDGRRNIAVGRSAIAALVAIALSAVFAPSASAQVGGEPIIAGNPVVGETLTSSSAGILGTYQWQRCDPAVATCDDADPANSADWADIPGAKSQNYTIPASDLGHHLRVKTGTLLPASNPSDGVGPVTNPPPPEVTTGVAGDITDTTATLNGSIDPNGRQTSYYFEYGTTTAYGSRAPVPDGDAGSGTALENVSAPISGLSPSTTYHFRLVAVSSAGTTEGADRTFTTTPLPPAPEVVTGGAHSITHEFATITGSVDPNGFETTYRFQYGPTTAYGFEAPLPHGSAGSGFVDVNVSASLAGLAPSTVYHYRLVATSSGGTTAGSDATFTTAPPPPPVAEHGVSLFAETTEGVVTAKLPGAREFIPLQEHTQVIPVDTVVDARRGTIELTAATGAFRNTTLDQSIEFFKGMFRVTQRAKRDARAVAELTGPRICGPFVHRKASSADAPQAEIARRTGRRLWGRGSGRYATRGRGGTGSVVGTTFLTEEKCSGTYFRVKDEPGAHGIRINPERGKSVFLGPGEDLLAEREPKK